ncbi:MAG: hypothetical protein FJ090_21795 [Deltaproteobacteria bacterium]|nr:hypothetical protein [Deltaproteobacteria bacterium]
MSLSAIHLGFQRTVTAQRYLLLLGPLLLLPGLYPSSREIWALLLCYLILPLWALALAGALEEAADRLWLGFGGVGNQLLGRILTQQAVLLLTTGVAWWMGVAGGPSLLAGHLLLLSGWHLLGVALRAALGKSGVFLAPFFAAAVATVGMNVALLIPFSSHQWVTLTTALGVILTSLGLAWWFEARGGVWGFRFARERSMLLLLPLVGGGLGAAAGSLVPTDRQWVLSVAPDADLALIQDCGWCFYQDAYRVSLLGPDGYSDPGIGPVKAALLGPRGSMVWVGEESQLHARLDGAEVACSLGSWRAPLQAEFDADGGAVQVEVHDVTVRVTSNGCVTSPRSPSATRGSVVDPATGWSGDGAARALPAGVRDLGGGLLQDQRHEVFTADGSQKWLVPGPLIAARLEGDTLIGWTRDARVIGERVK